MARSRVYDNRGRVIDLYNNYAHTSFNFGPTLLSWLARYHPRLVSHLADAVDIDRTFAMAQAYNHMILPLADARDRHTQILWGLREFHFRFGSRPRGMWLPECAINRDTVRALIDHGVGYIILSPHQASKARPFGETGWRDVAMGAIDTRRAYRLFETDGAGRTHFDRYLDVVFYTPGLNLKVSFDHILTRPDDLARELESCYRSDFPGAQLVSIVTDGEIYGHHEKHGEEALSRLFRDIAPALGLKVVSAEEFVRDNPPEWEVMLWNGDDGFGSSWSCQHGTGRWYRDCGCHPPTPSGWDQRWRSPLRQAFDAVRDRVRKVSRRELGTLVWDVDEATNDYIDLILDASPTSRRKFLHRHAQRPLDMDETERLWRILEALHNAMLMYASCGWFFDEISGLEPVQCMRYALRASLLIQPYCEEDVIHLLEEDLAHARSNIPHYGDGRQVFHELVLPSRHSSRELAAAMAVCLATGFPTDSLAWTVVDSTGTVNYGDSQGNNISWGSFVCHDGRLDRFVKTSWVTRLDDFDNSGVGLYGFEEVQGDPRRADAECPLCANPDFSWLREMESETRKLKRQELIERFGEFGVGHHRLPEVVRGMLYRLFAGEKESELVEDLARLGTKAVPFIARARRHGARVPDAIIKTVTNTFEQEMIQSVHISIAEMRFDESAIAAVEQPRDSARDLGIWPSQDSPSRAIFLTGMELIHWLAWLPDGKWLESRRPLILPEGGEWLAPVAQANHDQTYPSASGFSLALGKGLAKLRTALLAEENPGSAALRLIPLPELLGYAESLGFDVRLAIPLGIEYWDFLDKNLGRLVAVDPLGIMAGISGDRVRRIGVQLGFSEATVEERISAILHV